jgi:hypothetical protein
VEGAVVLGWMVPAVPLGIAMYPQHEAMLIDDLEDSLLRESLGNMGCRQVSFNRGL